MKRPAVFLLIFACVFSSPNSGVLFALSSPDAVAGNNLYKQSPLGLEAAKHSDVKVAELSQNLKKPRLLKRALFALDLRDVVLFSLLIFCLSPFFLFAVISRKPVQLLLRSPPQF